jgi:yeast amino acid transporter
VIVLYLGWKVYSRDWKLYVPIAEMDIKSGLRVAIADEKPRPPRTWKNLPMRMLRSFA